MAERFLVNLDMDRIQAYIFGTPRLGEIRGASVLLARPDGARSTQGRTLRSATDHYPSAGGDDRRRVRLHDPAPARPFTLSGLVGPLRRVREGLAVRAGASYHGRLTLLHTEAFEAFRQALGYQASHGCAFVLDWIEFDLAGLWDERLPPGRAGEPRLRVVR